MKLFTILFISLLATTAKAQDSTFVWTENRTIQWDDFLGQANDSSSYDAEVFAEVCYKYEFSKKRSPKFEVFALFNRSTSWCKPGRQTESLLKHEQLHFDIAELYALKLKQQFESFSYSENFAQEILQMFNALKAEYHIMQARCDEETNHSLNKEKQAGWEAYVNNELQKASGYATLSQAETKK